MLGLQLCGVLTSWQAAWTVITVLFTDCGTMFMFGSLMGLTSLLLVIASHQYEINERPSVLPPFPEDYALDYSWSFYLSWASLGLCIASGIMFLMVARQWHLEEVWFKKSLEEEKKRLPQQRYSRSKLIPSF
ncbi:transmembrane protein 178A-like [Lytechinus pictus]|uniref:transmembrane protein 178A-like n=1 Tax=Lytechinus pictus TaxID=7653 RepID=UPI0030B9F3F4